MNDEHTEEFPSLMVGVLTIIGLTIVVLSILGVIDMDDSKTNDINHQPTITQEYTP